MTISIIGDGVYLVAIPFQVFELSNAATALSIVGAAWTLPQVFLLLLGGILTDRFDRRHVLIASDITRSIAIGALGLLSLSGELELWHVYGLVALVGAGEAFFLPAFGAIVPDVVPKDLLVQANSLDQFVRPFAFRLVGPGLAGLLIALVGLGGAFIFDAATFAFSAAAIFFMKAHSPPLPRDDHRSAISELREGMRYVRERAWLWVGLLAAGLGLLAFYGPWAVLVPFVIKNQLSGGAADFALVLIAGGAGSILVSFAVGQWGMVRRPMALVLASWGIGAFLLAGFAFSGSLWQAMIVAGAMWGLLTGGQIVWVTLQHQSISRELLGRVSSLDWLVSTAPIPISFGLAGVLSETIGVDATLIGGGVVGGLSVLMLLFVRGARSVERVQPIEPPAEEMAQA